MDPLLGRFAAEPHRRRAALVVALLGAAVLVGAILVAGSASGGRATSLPAVAVARSSPSPTPLLVAVTGAVRRPGLVSLPAGARVVDAVAAAGGPAADADQGGVNLAAPVVDGQQVVVPGRTAAASGVGSSAAPASPSTPVSLSSATAEQLETLPRIGPAMAARIIAWRQAHGGFRSVDDLGEVGGIGPKTLAALRDRVTP